MSKFNPREQAVFDDLKILMDKHKIQCAHLIFKGEEVSACISTGKGHDTLATAMIEIGLMLEAESEIFEDSSDILADIPANKLPSA